MPSSGGMRYIGPASGSYHESNGLYKFSTHQLSLSGVTVTSGLVHLLTSRNSLGILCRRPELLPLIWNEDSVFIILYLHLLKKYTCFLSIFMLSMLMYQIFTLLW